MRITKTPKKWLKPRHRLELVSSLISYIVESAKTFQADPGPSQLDRVQSPRRRFRITRIFPARFFNPISIERVTMTGRTGTTPNQQLQRHWLENEQVSYYAFDATICISLEDLLRVSSNTIFGTLVGHDVCLKIGTLDNLREEAEFYVHLQDLQGTVIPQFYGLFSYLDLHFILLSRISGMEPTSLDDLSIPQRCVNTILLSSTTFMSRCQIINSLCRIHLMGVMHGDIALRNLVVQPDGFVTIIDFGMSCLHQCNVATCVEISNVALQFGVEVEKPKTSGICSSVWTVLLFVTLISSLYFVWMHFCYCVKEHSNVHTTTSRRADIHFLPVPYGSSWYSYLLAIDTWLYRKSKQIG